MDFLIDHYQFTTWLFVVMVSVITVYLVFPYLLGSCLDEPGMIVGRVASSFMFWQIINPVDPAVLLLDLFKYWCAIVAFEQYIRLQVIRVDNETVFQKSFDKKKV